MPHQVPHTSEIVFDLFGGELALSEDTFDEDDWDFFNLVLLVGGSQNDLHLEGITLAHDLRDDLVKHFLLVQPWSATTYLNEPVRSVFLASNRKVAMKLAVWDVR